MRRGGELQAPAGGEARRANLADDGGEGAAAQPFFHRPQDSVVGGGAGDQQPVGAKPEKGEAGAIKPGVAQAPQHGCPIPVPAGRVLIGDPGGKGSAEAGGGPGRSRDLVESAERKPIPGQRGVFARHGKPPGAAKIAGFDGSNAAPEIGDGDRWGRGGHHRPPNELI